MKAGSGRWSKGSLGDGSFTARNVLVVDSEDWHFMPINVTYLLRNGKARTEI